MGCGKPVVFTDLINVVDTMFLEQLSELTYLAMEGPEMRGAHVACQI